MTTKTQTTKTKKSTKPTKSTKTKATQLAVKNDTPEKKVQTRLLYIRQNLRKKTQPVGCMAYRISSDVDGTTITYGLSTHHPKDKFVRSIARDVAQGRLKVALATAEVDSNILTPFVKEIESSVFVQHTKNTSLNNQDQEVVVSGTYATEEENPVRALHDLLESLRTEERLPKRLQKCMKGMACHLWVASYTQEKKLYIPKNKKPN